MKREDAKGYHNYAIGYRDEEPPTCHVCNEGMILYRRVMHMRMARRLNIPKEGTILHGRFNEKGDIYIPNIAVYSSTNYTIKNLPEDIGNQIFEMKYLSSEANDIQINSIVFEFVQTVQVP